jgi:hypothetical protein
MHRRSNIVREAGQRELRRPGAAAYNFRRFDYSDCDTRTR